MSSTVDHQTNNSHSFFNLKSLWVPFLHFQLHQFNWFFLTSRCTLPWVSCKNVFITWKNLYQCRTMSHSSNLTKKSISPSKVSSYVVGHYCHITSFLFFQWTTEGFSASHDMLSWVNHKDTTREGDFDLNFKTFLLIPFPPISANWHLQILLCLTPDDFTRQWGRTWTGKG